MRGQDTRLTLPSGLWLDGAHLRVAALRPLTGEDELALAALAADALPLPELMTSLLARCVVSLGGVAPVPAWLIASLSVGDREALLLRLRGLSYGNRLDGVLNCVHCGAKLDLDLTTDGLLVAPYPQPAPAYELALNGVTVTFRLPNGEDEAVIAQMSGGLDAAEDELLRRCLVRVTPDDQPLSDALVEAVEQAMLDCDPQAELDIAKQCPECDRAFTALFDAAQFFVHEIGQRAAQIYREVHALALAYHWSERDILALSYPRRQMYLTLLDEGGTL